MVLFKCFKHMAPQSFPVKTLLGGIHESLAQQIFPLLQYVENSLTDVFEYFHSGFSIIFASVWPYFQQVSWYCVCGSFWSQLGGE